MRNSYNEDTDYNGFEEEKNSLLDDLQYAGFTHIGRFSEKYKRDCDNNTNYYDGPVLDYETII